MSIYAQGERGKLSIATDLGLMLKDSKANIYFSYQFINTWYLEGGCMINTNSKEHVESFALGNWIIKRGKAGLKLKFEIINQSSVDFRVGLSYQICIFKGIFIDTGITYPLINDNTINTIIRMGWEF